jgi:dTDP-4-amino-4,6-dideoxygalactose transaminase
MPGPGMDIIGKEEKEQVLDCLEGGWVFRYGDFSNPAFKAKVWNLEKEFSEYMRVKHSLAVTSGTVALYTALSALGVGPGDEVIVPAYTFIATVSSVVYARAIPVLAEINDTLNIDPEDIERKITKKTKAIIPVHMLGNAAEMDKIMKIAKKHKLLVLEDVAQACGGSFKGKKLGTIGNMGTFSFNVFKTITTGDGGMVITNDKKLYERAFAFHDQGHLPMRQGVEVGNRPIIGLDFRMNEVTGALGLAQLRKLDFIIGKLRRNKKRFKDGIKDLKNIKFRRLPDENGDCATLLTIIVEDEKKAGVLAKELGTCLVWDSGWHVYDKWEQILNKKTVTKEGCPFTCPYYGKKVVYKHNMCPKTDNILKRAINISIGVSDKGLGSAFGVTINGNNDVIDQNIEKFRNIVKKVLG